MAKKSKTNKPSNPQMEKVITQAGEGDVRPNVQAFVDWVAALGGPEMDPEHTQIVISGYKYFQGSDAAKQYRAEVAATRDEERAAKQAAQEKKRQEREAAKAEEAERKAASKKAAEKPVATKGKATAKKTAAASSTPAKTTTKATPAKKTAAKRKGTATKAAF